MTHFSFPQEFLSPLPTALGPAWPSPKTRMILADLDNIQKRLTDLRMRLDGVKYLKLPMEEKRKRFDELMAQGKKMEDELQDLMYKLKESPSRKPHFKDPRRQISRCCDSYVRPGNDDDPEKDECIECGRKGESYNRIEEEKWEEEYAELLREKEKDRLKDLQAIKVTTPTSKPPASKGIDGGFLLT